MPTGYTSNIKTQTFPEFALTCAKAFGSCIDIRDQPFDSPIPEQFEVSEYYNRNLKEAEARLHNLVTASPDELEKMRDKEYSEYVTLNLQLRSEMIELREKYVSMLKEVTNWVPPTDQHQPLKKFMIEQLEQSIHHDTDDNWYTIIKPKPSIQEWYQKQLTLYKSDIEFCFDKLTSEHNRVEKNNVWIKELKESLRGYQK